MESALVRGTFAGWAGVLLLGASSAHAFELGRPPSDPSQQPVTLRASGLLDPSGLAQSSVSLGVPVLKAERDGLSLKSSWSSLDLESSVPDYGRLQVADFGLAYTRKFSELDYGSLNAVLGSSSDALFSGADVLTVNLTAMYLTKTGSESSWLFLLNYSNQRSFLNGIPLPGFAYLYEPSREFRGVFGVPAISILQKWPSGWGLSVFTLIPWVMKGQVSYAVAGPVQVFAGVEWSQLSFLKAGRANPSERLIFDEKRAFLGARSPVTQALFLELEGGIAGDRRVFQAEGYTPSPETDARVVHLLPTGPYGRLTLSGRW